MVAIPARKNVSFAEFVVIVSLMMSLTALSIDAMLPALAQIGTEFALENPNDRQLVISMIFLGLASGQLFFGPLSDSIGRKPAIYIGYVLYVIGAFISVFSVSFPMMLAGRLLQGLGVSAPRGIALALVRDKYEGNTMAQVMSFVMTVFILVPMLAPSLGQGILLFTGWRWIFVALIAIAVTSVLWFAIRMPETLDPKNRAPFSANRILNAATEVLKDRVALGYTISAGFIGGAFLGYLNSSQQIFQEQYALGDWFAVIFGVIAVSIGLASLSNSQLVMRFGMRFLIKWALRIVVGLAVIALTVSLAANGQPPLVFLIGYLMLSFFCVGILFGNQNAIAMQPLGHIAGIGSAVVGSLSTFIMMPIGTIIGQQYNGTVIPLIIGLGVLGILSLVVVNWAEMKPTK